MPKPAPTTNKRSAVLNHILSSRTCHTLKDLEKSIPSAVTGVSPIQVKDLIQALLDEEELRVEKIGSGNWYWRFGAADLIKLHADQQSLENERQKLESDAENVKAEMQLIDSERGHDNEVEERAEIQSLLYATEREVESLRRELIGYSDFNPNHLEQLQEQVDLHQSDAEKWTEMIHSMAGWVKMNAGLGREALAEIEKDWYGQEWDEDDGGLKEL